MKPALIALAALAVTLLPSGLVQAHEVRPGYLELREQDAERFRVLWKVPARGEMRLSIDPRFPVHCTPEGEPLTVLAAGAYVMRSAIACPGGLYGHAIAIAGLEAVMTDVIVRVERADGTAQAARLTPEAPRFTVLASTGALAVARSYLGLGVEHILFGVDHLLFVLGLIFLATGWRQLIATITAFTLAHSLTLAAASLGWVRVPQQPVEAVIALSIAFVACEILRARDGRAGLAARSPWLVAFAFGLLHGFGFAGALTEVGLPERAIPLALLFFNVGVEVGQLLFIAAVLSAFRLADLWRGRPAGDPARELRPAVAVGAAPAAYVIGTLAVFWVIERTRAFWT